MKKIEALGNSFHVEEQPAYAEQDSCQPRHQPVATAKQTRMLSSCYDSIPQSNTLPKIIVQHMLNIRLHELFARVYNI